MTVKELIKELQKYPEDMKVNGYCYFANGDYEITEPEVNKEGTELFIDGKVKFYG